MLERGLYGVEWTPRPKDTESSGLGRVVLVVIALAAVSLTWTLISRHRSRVRERAEEARMSAPAEPVRTAPAAAPKPAAQPAPGPEFHPPATSGTATRPPIVRNLLMRLSEAEKKRDIEMAITTIEQLRTLPGSQAADLDDDLARRLGVLNMRRLFVLKSQQWVTTVTVKSGDSASRIAAEHGSTLASFAKLNDNRIETLRSGQKVVVLNHPRFSLVVRRRMRTADLQLNGKFFKRYDLAKETTGANGAYEISFPVRAFWKSIGVELKAQDRAEVEMLLPKGATVIVSEM